MKGGKGDQFKADAIKAMNRSTLFGFGKTQKFEDAAESFTKAGNAYKLSNDHLSAAEMFKQAYECFLKVDSKSEAVNSLVEAGNSYKKISPSDAIETYNQAIEMYNDSGRFAVSARYYKEIAEIYENDKNDEMAIEAYQQAANIFINDNKKSASSQCLLKIATIASLNEQYSKAGDIFGTMGKESIESNLGKYSAKGYFFQSVLCYMAAGDNVGYKSKLEEYKCIDYSFPACRECDFLEKIISSIDSSDEDAFSQACVDFDRITPLDPWKTSILLKIKAASGIDGNGEDDVC